MTAEQLEELLGKVTQGDWLAFESDEGGWFIEAERGMIGDIIASDMLEEDSTLIALAPYLARRVIAAEKLVEMGGELQRLWAIGIGGRDLSWRTSIEQVMEEHAGAITAYREASK